MFIALTQGHVIYGELLGGLIEQTTAVTNYTMTINIH